MFKKLSLAAVLTVGISGIAMAAPQGAPQGGSQSGSGHGAAQQGSHKSSVIAPAPKGARQGGSHQAPAAAPHHAHGAPHKGHMPQKPSAGGHSQPQPPMGGGAHHQGSGAGHVQAPKIDINQASAKTLQMLPGIGPKEAKKIVKYRKKHGNFKSVSDMQKVGGVKKATMTNFSDVLKAGKGNNHASGNKQKSNGNSSQ